MTKVRTAAGMTVRMKVLHRWPAIETTVQADLGVAAVKAATAFSLPEELPPLEEGVAQFYGAVGGVLCSTLWDPGSSVNLITPDFAEELRCARLLPP